MLASVKTPKKFKLAALCAAGFFIGTFASSVHAMCRLDLPKDMLMNEEDHARHGLMYQSRARGLADSLRSKNATERTTIANLVREIDDASKSGKELPSISALQGKYACQVMKLGRFAHLVIYKPFRCRIDSLDGNAAIEKLSGSQRFSGTLTPLGGGFIYVGAGHYSDEKPRNYDDEPKQNETGCMIPLNGAKRMVLEIPKPRFDSDHDFVLFTRTEN